MTADGQGHNRRRIMKTSSPLMVAKKVQNESLNNDIYIECQQGEEEGLILAESMVFADSGMKGYRQRRPVKN